MTTQRSEKSILPSGCTPVTEPSMRSVKVPCDPVTSRTTCICPLPTRWSDTSTSVPESLIPPDADHVPVCGPIMTVLWIVTGTDVLAAAGVPAAPSSSSTGVRHTPMNDSRRIAPLLSLRAAVWQPNDYCYSGAGNRCECGSSQVTSSPGAGRPYCG